MAFSSQYRGITIKVLKAKDLIKKDIFGASDPYVRIELRDKKSNMLIDAKKTHKKRKTLNPEWNEEFKFTADIFQHKLVLDVFDANRMTRDDFLGRVDLTVEDFNGSNFTDVKKYLLKARSWKSRVNGTLELQFALSENEKQTSSLSLPAFLEGQSSQQEVSSNENAGVFHGIERVESDPVDLDNVERLDEGSVERVGIVDSMNESTLERIDERNIEAFARDLELPPGWEERTDANGRTFYIDHANRRTQWTHPALSMVIGEQSTDAMDDVERLDFKQRVHVSLDEERTAEETEAAMETDAVLNRLWNLDQRQPSHSPDAPLSSASEENNMPAEDDNDLPANWSKKTAENGRVFYLDHTNKKTTWTHPVTGKTSPLPSATGGASYERPGGLGPLPAGWEERINKDGRTFFIDHNNRRTQWEDPRLSMRQIAGKALPYNRDYKVKYENFMIRLRPTMNKRLLKLKIRRNKVLEDSYQQIMLVSQESFLKGQLDIEFERERGLDYGGLSREWFYILSKEIFNPYYGFFEYSAADNYTLQINPYSGYCNENHLKYFEFFGIIAGMAVLNGKLLDGFFIRPFYKMLLNKDISLNDMESVDAEYYNSLVWIKDNDPSDLGLCFEVEENCFGAKKTVELKKGGKDIEVSNSNKNEYIREVINWRFISRVKPQMQAFRVGFNKVIPLQMIKVFDEGELELLLGGIGQIDVKDWKTHTEYKGGYHENHIVIQWFWRLVLSMSNEMRSRLLQFVTGTSRVPVNGFRELYGSNGPRLFCIQEAGSPDSYPLAHTCFNRIDLPPYRSYEELVKKVIGAIEGASGFDIQ